MPACRPRNRMIAGMCSTPGLLRLFSQFRMLAVSTSSCPATSRWISFRTSRRSKWSPSVFSSSGTRFRALLYDSACHLLHPPLRCLGRVALILNAGRQFLRFGLASRQLP